MAPTVRFCKSVFIVSNVRPIFIATFLMLSSCASFVTSHGQQWKTDSFVTHSFRVSGTDDRNNPLRRALKAPFSGAQLFVRMHLTYEAESIDAPPEGDGEFLVLWLDTNEGGPGSTHAGHVPNVGIHVQKTSNRFMVRYRSRGEKFGPVLQGDREFQIVARLSKSNPGASKPFDQLSLWVDPSPKAELAPLATVTDQQAIAAVSWIGISTGRKTEMTDVIHVRDIATAGSWAEIMQLPSAKNEPEPPPEKTVDFQHDVYPILKRQCFTCHSESDNDSGVRLDIFDEVLNQTAPRNAEQSQLHQLIAQGKMPPDEQLSKRELATIGTWINEGLDWDEDLLPTPVPKTDHWAFQPIKRPAVPKIKNVDWIRTPVDSFIGAEHERLGLVPNPPADPHTLNRRMSLDILGLPPSKSAAESNSKLLTVDDLLSDPAYGQRWGRHWLDVARWAESNGHQHNRIRPHAWRYRDWVIRAFNDGMPYDKFLRDQIAGDELQPFNADQSIATGFLAAARYSGNELDKRIQLNDILRDATNTTASAFLGLTLECAECHTHKFDPLSIRDYYRFQAFFGAGKPGSFAFNASESDAELVRERWQIFDETRDRIVSSKRRQGHPEPIYVIPKTVLAGMKPKQKTRFNELDSKIAKLDQAWCFVDPRTSGDSLLSTPHEMRWPLPRDTGHLPKPTTSILIRGDINSPGPEVDAAWPIVFGPRTDESPATRTQLAAWLADPDHPLTARVWVNRIWQWHFGRGLVETSSDFGTQGTRPSHPKLLDFLASELIDHNWSTDHIHRLILNSSTYRQGHEHSASNAQIDPDNTYQWRWLPRRLEAESIRDCLLAVSGKLDRTPGGPSDSGVSNRRSVFLQQKRDALPGQQVLFDGADGITSCSRRRTSTTALQPLWLLNSSFAQKAADGFAKRSGSIDQAIRIALGRPPTEDELAILNKHAQVHGLASACLVILNSSEFLYLP